MPVKEIKIRGYLQRIPQTMSASIISGYFSVSVHIESFCPSAAFFSLTAPRSSFMGCLNRGRELIIPFSRLDFSPMLSGLSASSYESATLLKAGSSTDSSLGVHFGGKEVSKRSSQYQN